LQGAGEHLSLLGVWQGGSIKAKTGLEKETEGEKKKKKRRGGSTCLKGLFPPDEEARGDKLSEQQRDFKKEG